MKLNNWLLNDMPQYKSQAFRFPEEEQAQWQLFRSLVNVREPAHDASAVRRRAWADRNGQVH